jgi:singapore isolate B (sub-type 7) whole genome shotgun sequence assembly, scaffold_15
MGEKERNGKKLFVPGDVPPSDLLQKRTASYAVQSLVMGARKDGKAYNSARYSVSFPHAEQNKKRGIPVSEIRKRHTMDVETTNAPSARPKEMTQYYVYDLQESTISLFDMIMEDMSPLSEPVSTETTIKYFGQMSQSTYDITLTLQTTSMSMITLTCRMVRFTYLSMFLRRWGGPISAVIRVTPSEYPTVQRMLKKSHFPARLVVSVVIDAGDDYPINFLRNAAIRAAATSHFFVCDMDVWPLGSKFPPFFTPRIGIRDNGRDHGQ